LKASLSVNFERFTLEGLSNNPGNVKLWESPRHSRGFTAINYLKTATPHEPVMPRENTMTDTPEEMKSFFDLRVESYDEHMSSNVEDFNEFYSMIAAPFEKTDRLIEVLDVGAGTGIELEFIFAKAPNAKITAVDLSEEMLLANF